MEKARSNSASSHLCLLSGNGKCAATSRGENWPQCERSTLGSTRKDRHEEVNAALPEVSDMDLGGERRVSHSTYKYEHVLPFVLLPVHASTT